MTVELKAGALEGTFILPLPYCLQQQEQKQPRQEQQGSEQQGSEQQAPAGADVETGGREAVAELQSSRELRSLFAFQHLASKQKAENSHKEPPVSTVSTILIG